MNLSFTRNALVTAVLSASVIACSSDSGDGGSSAPAVPANAVVIDNPDTAEAITASALDTGQVITAAFGVQAAAVTGRDVLNAIEAIKERVGQSPSAATGVAFTEPCDGGGSISGDSTETDTSDSGSFTATNCVIGQLTMNGTLSYSSTWNNTTGAYTDNANGNLSVVFAGDSFTFNNFKYTETGNESSGDFTITAFNYSINPSGGGGYAAQVTAALTGNTFAVCDLDGGQFTVTGGSGSQARATINDDGSAVIEYHSGDGNFGTTSNSPIPPCF